MSADARMVGVNQNGSRAASIPLEKGWLRLMKELGFTVRVADVGEPLLSTVTVLSVVEAARINKGFEQQATEDLQRSNDLDRPLCLARLQCAERVAALLEKMGCTEYFSPWVIVETADID